MMIFKSLPGWVLLIGLLFIQIPCNKVSAHQRKSVELEKALYQCWKYETPSDYKVASDNVNKLFLSDSRNVLDGITSDSGLKDWETQIGGQILTEPVIYKDSLIQLIRIGRDFSKTQTEEKTEDQLLADAKANIYLVRSTNKMTGVTNWQTSIPADDLHGEIYSHLFEDKFIIISTFGDLISIRISDGSFQQKKKLNFNTIIKPFYGTSKFYIAAQNKQVSAISLSDFSQTLQFETSSPVATLLVSGNLLIWGDKRGLITASNPGNTGKNIKWKSRKGGEILSLTNTVRGILAASSDNYIYLLSENSGQTIWKKRLFSSAAFEPTVLGGYVFISTVAENESLILELSTGKIVNRIILADGNLSSAPPRLLEGVIVFVTLQGLIAYSNTPCSNSNGK